MFEGDSKSQQRMRRATEKKLMKTAATCPSDGLVIRLLDLRGKGTATVEKANILKNYKKCISISVYLSTYLSIYLSIYPLCTYLPYAQFQSVYLPQFTIQGTFCLKVHDFNT